jgi:hypothetical protein
MVLAACRTEEHLPPPSYPLLLWVGNRTMRESLLNDPMESVAKEWGRLTMALWALAACRGFHQLGPNLTVSLAMVPEVAGINVSQ